MPKSTLIFPFQVHNNTSLSLLVKQMNILDPGEEVAPRTTCPWAWSEPSAPERLVQVQTAPGSNIELTPCVPRYSLDEVASLGTFRAIKKGWKSSIICHVRLVLSGVTKVLQIEEAFTGEVPTLEGDFEVIEPSMVGLAVKLSLPGISVSLVSGVPNEIFHAWLDTISLEVESGTRERTLQLTVAGCQVDSQLHSKVYDTVLWGKAQEKKPFFHLAINMGTNYSGSGISFFNGIEVVMQDLNVTVDEAIVTHVLHAVYDLLEYLDRSLNQQVVRRAPDYTQQRLVTSDMIYARLLLFGPVRVTLSYSSCAWGAASLKGDVVEKILTLLGPVSGLERAALQLNRFERLHHMHACTLVAHF
jgi:hypothetical protein